MIKPDKLAKLINEGIQRVSIPRHLKGRKTRKFISDQMKPTRSPQTLRDWTARRRKTPIPENILSSFAYVCLTNAPELTEEWVHNLFEANDMGEKYYSKQLQETIQRKATERLKAAQKELSIPTRQEPEALHQSISTWNRDLLQASGTRTDFKHAFIHTRLEGFSDSHSAPDSEIQPQTTLHAEDLLYMKQAHVVIVGKPGSGKSFLRKYLAYLLELGVVENVLVIPLNLALASDCSSLEDFIRLTLELDSIDEDIDADTQGTIQYILNALEQGTAIALIDNWNDLATFETGRATQLHTALRKWKRVIIFSRYIPTPLASAYKVYRLPPLNNQELQLFTRNWTGANPLDAESLLTEISLSSELHGLATHPLFLDLICEIAAHNQPLPKKRWQILNQALHILIEKEIGIGANIPRLKAVLAKLAWQGYAPVLSQDPIRYTFSATETSQIWYQTFGNQGNELFDQVFESGLLRQEAGEEERLAFAFPELQTLLATNAWLIQQDWRAQIAKLRTCVDAKDVLVFAAAKLEREECYFELEELLTGIINPGQDLTELRWLIAGECLAELETTTIERLERTGIVTQIREGLDLLQTTSSYLLQETIDAIVCKIQTAKSTQELGDQIRVHHPDSIRLDLISSLGKIGNSQTLQILMKILNTENESWASEYIHTEALIALGATRAPEAIPVLEGWLTSHPAFYAATLHALALHNTPAAAALLIKHNGTQSTFDAIAQLSNPQILPILEQALTLTPQWTIPILKGIAHIGGEPAVHILATQLHAQNATVTKVVAKMLGKMRTKSACEALLHYAEDEKNPGTRRNAALSALPAEHGLWNAQRVIQLLETENLPNAVEYGALQALRHTMDSQLRFHLLAKLKQISDPHPKWHLVHIMAGTQQTTFIPKLLELAHDRNPEIRSEAIHGLGKMHVNEAADLALTELEQALEHNWSTYQLIWTLGELKVTRALPTLRQVLQTTMDTTDWINNTEALGKIGGPEAVAILIKQWETCCDNSLQRSDILEALVKTGEPEAVQFLIALGTDPDAKWPADEALDYLDRVRNPAAINTLIAALTHQHRDVREYCAKALGHIGEQGYIEAEHAIPKLFDLLRDEHEDEYVRERDYRALQTFPHVEQPEAISVIFQAATEGNVTVQSVAAQLLGKIAEDQLRTAYRQQILQLCTNKSRPAIQQAAIRVWGKIGDLSISQRLRTMLENCSNGDTAWVIAETLTQIGDATAIPTIVWAYRKGLIPKFPNTNAISFLCTWLDHRPWTDTFLTKLCFQYNIRLLSDHSVVLPNGRQVSCEAAAQQLHIAENMQLL